MSRIASRRNNLITYGLACILGAAYVGALGLIGQISFVSLSVVLLFSFVGMSAATYFLARRVPTGTDLWPIGGFVFIGISVAILASAIYDWTVNHRDRNLFPFEIALCSALAMPGVIAGLALRWSVQRDKRTGSKQTTDVILLEDPAHHDVILLEDPAHHDATDNDER